eukprot:5237103-Alexandrium_andersonii.AAC.1
MWACACARASACAGTIACANAPQPRAGTLGSKGSATGHMCVLARATLQERARRDTEAAGACTSMRARTP